MRKSGLKNQDYNQKFDSDDIKKQIEAIQSRDTQMKWRLQYNQKYRSQILNTGELNQSRRTNLQQAIFQKSQRQRVGQALSPQRLGEISWNNSNIIDSQMSINFQKQNEISLSPIARQILTKDSILSPKENNTLDSYQKKKKNKGESPRTKKSIENIKNSSSSNNNNNNKISYIGLQSLRHRKQNTITRSFSLMELKNNSTLSSQRGKKEVVRLLANNWNSNQIQYTIQNEASREMFENDKSLSPQIISNENELRSSKFSLALTKNQKQQKDLRHENLKPVFKNTLGMLSQSPKQERKKSRIFTQPSQLCQTTQSPLPHHPHKEYGEFFPSQFFIQNSMHSSPKISLTEIEMHKTDSYSLKIPLLQLPMVRKQQSEQKCSIRSLKSPSKKCIGNKDEGNSSEKQIFLNIPISPIMNKKQISIEENISLNKQSSSKDRTRREEINQIEALDDWELPRCCSITDSINKFYSFAGKSQKQLQILKQQEHIIERIEKSNSIPRCNSNYNLSNQEQNNQQFQHSLQHLEKSLQNHIKREETSNDKLNTVNNQALQYRNNRLLSDISPVNQTGFSVNISKTERDSTPINLKTNIWVSTELPFQNSSYELFPQGKQSQQTKEYDYNVQVTSLNNKGNLNSPNTTKSTLLIKDPIDQSTNKNNLKTQQMFAEHIFEDSNQNQQQFKSYEDEVLSENSISNKQQQQENKSIKSSIYNQFLKSNGFNKTLANSQSFNKHLRQTINERFRNSSQYNFEKQIADKTIGQTKVIKQSALATFKGIVQFRFGKNKNKNLVIAQDKEKFKQFLKINQNPPSECKIPKDTQFSEILPQFKLHEMKFMSKATQFGEENENLQKIYTEGCIENENNKHNILQYEDSYILEQENKMKYDLLTYREYKDYRKINEYPKKRQDGWFNMWIKQVDQESKKAETEIKRNFQGLDLLKLVNQQEVDRKHKIRQSLLSTLMKFIKLNLSLNEVYANRLFVRGQIEREMSAQFIEAVKQNNLVEFNQLVKEDKYLVYSTDYLLQSPLHWAAKRGHIQLITYLIQLKADIEARDIFGRTPLYYAYREGHKEIATILMKNKACPWSDKQNNISKYANHKSCESIYRYYRISKKMHLMLTMCPPRQRFEIWTDFKNLLEKLY